MADAMRGKKMKTKISVQSQIADRLCEFIEQEKIELEVVTDSSGNNCALIVADCSSRKQSDLKTLYCGGWISCSQARAVAKRIGVSVANMGKLLDFMNIKIRQCELGCF